MRCLQQMLPFFWLVVAGALRQREAVDEGGSPASLFVPERAGNKAEGKPLNSVNAEMVKTGKSTPIKGTPEPVCVERFGRSRMYASSVGESLAEKDPSGQPLLLEHNTRQHALPHPAAEDLPPPLPGSLARSEESSTTDAALEEVKLGSRHLANILKSKRAYITMVELCDQVTERRQAQGYHLVRAFVLAKSLQQVNSSYPLAVLIVDSEDCPMVNEYNDRVIKDLNLMFMRLPKNLFTPDVLPQPIIPSYRFNYPKAYLFAMEAFERLVYLDAETMVLRNMDDLFDLPQPRTIRANRPFGSCNRHPFSTNGDGTGYPLKASTNFLVVKPHVADFHAMKYRYLTARQNGEYYMDGLVTMNMLFGGEVGRLEVLPPADYLYADCLEHFKCNVDLVRALHLGEAGNRVINQKPNGVEIEMDHAWKPVFLKWAGYCNSQDVTAACNGHCVDLCLSLARNPWHCKHC